mgnify:CR=1 FL=1
MAYFQLADPSRSFIIGGYTAGVATIKTGLLVVSDTVNALTLAGTTDKPDGFALANRTNVYAPTALTLDVGEYASVIQGHVLAYVDSAFFYGASLPAVNGTIWTSPNGLMSATDVGSAVKLGKCVKLSDYRTPPNSVSNIVCVELELGGKEMVR